MSRALRPALTLCACIATVGLSACSAASTDGSGDSASSDAHGLTSTQSGAPTAQSGSSGGLYETGYLQLGQCFAHSPPGPGRSTSPNSSTARKSTGQR